MFCIGHAAISFGAPSHGVKYTKHNFSTTAPGAAGTATWYSAGPNPETEICIFCHTPHNAAAGKKFLWNKNNTVNTFQMYTSSPTLDFTTNPSAPSSVSKMCLTCHDGAGAINAMANPKSTGAPSMVGGLTGDQLSDYWDGPAGFNAGRWGPNIGEYDQFGDNKPAGTGGGELFNDHPISFIYSQSESDPSIINSSGSSVGGLPLWWENGGYRLECVTCHDPHINSNPLRGGDAAYRYFLRKTNYSSSLCFTCHNK